MKKVKLLKTLTLTTCVFVSSVAFAQTTINVSSNSATINGMQFDYSIGEMTIVSTEKNNNLIVTQGFLQPNSSGRRANDSQTSGLTDFASLIKVYPNPTDNILFIENETAFSDSFDFQLIDVSGKTITSKQKATQLNERKYRMNLSALAVGSYFLIMQQTDKNGLLQNTSFKIQKTN